MNYKIINDEKELIRFIEMLPNLNNNEIFYVSLISRNKYMDINDKKIFPDKIQLKRFTSNKEMLFDKIKQLECELGFYKYKGLPVPENSIALYIHPNPRCLITATKSSALKLTNFIFNNVKNKNPHQIVLSEIQKSKSYTEFIDYDFDNVSDEKTLIEKIIPLTGNKDAVIPIKTKNGLHVLVNPRFVELTKIKTFHNSIINLGSDKSGDQLLPIPGTSQGGFIPKILNL